MAPDQHDFKHATLKTSDSIKNYTKLKKSKERADEVRKIAAVVANVRLQVDNLGGQGRITSILLISHA